MRLLRIFLVCALVIPIASAQTKFIGSYPAAGAISNGDLIPVVQGGQLFDATAAQLLTYMYQFFAVTFANLSSGTGTGTYVVGTGGSLAPGGTGIVSANQANGLAIPVSCGVGGTNSSGQIICITATGGLGASANQIYNTWQLTAYTIATLPTCNGTTNVGVEAYVTNGVASPTYLAAVSATGAANRSVFCDGTGWLYR